LRKHAPLYKDFVPHVQKQKYWDLRPPNNLYILKNRLRPQLPANHGLADWQVRNLKPVFIDNSVVGYLVPAFDLESPEAWALLINMSHD